MATVNYSVPEGVKQRFNALFQGRNKSRIIADLMLRAIEDEERRLRREAAMERLERRRRHRPRAGDGEVRAAREGGRP